MFIMNSLYFNHNLLVTSIKKYLLHSIFVLVIKRTQHCTASAKESFISPLTFELQSFL